jgi:hypothetical protein
MRIVQSILTLISSKIAARSSQKTSPVDALLRLLRTAPGEVGTHSIDRTEWRQE